MKVVANNIEEAANMTGIPIDILRYGQKNNIEGFNANKTVNTEKVKYWYETNKEDIEEQFNESLEYYKIEEKKKKLILMDLEIKEKQRNLIEPSEVKQLLLTIATAQSAILKKALVDIPIKGAGKGEAELKTLVEQCINEYFKIILNKATEYK